MSKSQPVMATAPQVSAPRALRRLRAARCGPAQRRRPRQRERGANGGLGGALLAAPLVRGQTPLNRRKSAAPEMLLGENDDEKEKENLRAQNADTPTAPAANSFTPFKKMLDRWSAAAVVLPPPPPLRLCLCCLPRYCAAENCATFRKLVSLTPPFLGATPVPRFASLSSAAAPLPTRVGVRLCHCYSFACSSEPLRGSSCPQSSENRRAPTSSALRIS